MPVRYDTCRIDGSSRTPAGALRVPATLTRSGVFTYETTDGKKVREYRPPDEVARADSLASYEDAPVTIGHPRRGVSPDSYRDDSVGHVRAGTIAAKDGTVGSELVVGRRDAIEKVERRDLSEISCGYDVRIDETPGVTPAGESYDRVQRDITINHVALLPAGAGRMGRQCSLRLDGEDEAIEDDRPEQKETKMKVKIRKDGKEVEVEAGSPEHIAYLEARADEACARADEAAKTLAQRDADAAKQARASLEAQARGVLGKDAKLVRSDSDATPMTDREIKEAVVKRTDSTFDPAGKTDAYIDARYDIALKAQPSATVAAPAVASVVNALNGTETPARADAAGPETPAAYAARMQARADGAYRPVKAA